MTVEDEDSNTQFQTILSPKNNTMTEDSDIDISSINEAQVLLACRAYLLRKHKVEWKEKKRRAQAEASPSNSGFFWPDADQLRYLREDPDPYNLDYNETYAISVGFKRNGVRFLTSQELVDKSVQPENKRASTSANPFSTNPLFPSDEHVRRSNAKIKLWNNQTWVDGWYKKRWAGKVATQSKKRQEKLDKLLRRIPNDVLESPSFDAMTGDEVAEAIVTYLTANQRKSESRKSIKDKRQLERESFKEWKEKVKQEAHDSKIIEQNITMRDVVQKLKPPLNDDVLSFSPSVETMKRLRAQRSEKSRRTFQTRLDNRKANLSSSSSKKRNNMLRMHTQENKYTENDLTNLNDQLEGGTSPMQAILHVDMALDNNDLPSPIDVEIILKPGRLGRRRATLIRILRERFDLRGKCVPALSGDSGLLFVTNCTIKELGLFVLSKLRQQIADG